MSESAQQIAQKIKEKAQSLGFDLCGITSASQSKYRDAFSHWIDSGQHGTMHYLAARREERLDPKTYFPPANSIISLAMNYYVKTEESDCANPGKIARYALGEDYHRHIKDRLHKLADWMKQNWPGTESRACVDTAPVLEREIAMRAGIGWQGKNTCVINPKIGSWIFLAEIFTSLQLPIDVPETDHCGTCTRCIDACPTGAITSAYHLDATKCISYLTIEHRSELSKDQEKMVGEWLFGCDICQDVCPFNTKAPSAIDALLQPRFAPVLDTSKPSEWSLEEYHTFTRRNAMRRVSLPMLQRNARIVRENLKSEI